MNGQQLFQDPLSRFVILLFVCAGNPMLTKVFRTTMKMARLAAALRIATGIPEVFWLEQARVSGAPLEFLEFTYIGLIGELP